MANPNMRGVERCPPTARVSQAAPPARDLGVLGLTGIPMEPTQPAAALAEPSTWDHDPQAWDRWDPMASLKDREAWLCWRHHMWLKGSLLLGSCLILSLRHGPLPAEAVQGCPCARTPHLEPKHWCEAGAGPGPGHPVAPLTCSQGAKPC